MSSSELPEWSETERAESTCKKRIRGSTQSTILASAYVLCHFLSGRPIYQVEWHGVGSRWVGQAASPDERFVPKD